MDKAHNGTHVRGNTITRTRHRAYCLTINNYTDKEYETFIQQSKKKDWKYIVGKEVGDEKQTPHLQCYINHKNPIDFEGLKKLFPRAHIEKANGSIEDNYIYCSKGGDFKTNIEIKTDLIKLAKENVLKEYEGVVWKDWQRNILDIIESKPDRRTINWFYEETGNVGKSYLSKYIYLTYPCILGDGSKKDVYHQIHTWFITQNVMPRVVILDIPRGEHNNMNYSMFESIKNGLIFSGKYEGGCIVMENIHVIIFCNEEPERLRYSDDRWNIVRIE